MKPLPLPVRVAAGLAVTAVDRARHLPEKLAELPVTMVSQALQLSMRLQQQVTELAIKGDDALATLRPVEESPEWATFDEDLAEGQQDAGHDNVNRSRFDAAKDTEDAEADGESNDPWAAEEQALAHEVHDDAVPNNAAPGFAEADGTETDNVDDSVSDDVASLVDAGTVDGPAALPNYTELTLPQVRARLRRLDAAQVTELMEYERSHADRPAFVGMLTRRLGTLHDQQ